MLFGVPVNFLLSPLGCNTKLNYDSMVPFFLADCMTWIRRSHLETEGLFRNCSQSRLAELRTAFETNSADLFNYRDHPDVVAGIIKLFFRELPQPLATYHLYDEFVGTLRYRADPSLFLKVCDLRKKGGGGLVERCSWMDGGRL